MTNLDKCTKELFEGRGWEFRLNHIDGQLFVKGRNNGRTQNALSFNLAREIAKEVKRRELKAENNILAMLDGRCRGYIKRFKSPNVQDWHLEIEQQLKELEEE